MGDLGGARETAFRRRRLASPSAPGYAELFPDIPPSMFGVSVPETARALADAASPVGGRGAGRVARRRARGAFERFWSDETASGFKLLTGNSEYELALAVLAFLWATSRPGVISGAFDAYVVRASGPRGDRAFEPESVRLGGRLGDGSFGQVFAAVDLETDRAVVVKQAKGVQGAAQLQRAEEYMNRRIRRYPLVAFGCAPYLGRYDVVEGAASPTLVWAREGDVTLEDMINSRDYPGCVEEALYGAVSDSDDFAARTNKVAKCVLRGAAVHPLGLHDIGIVHRDVKPANLVLAEDDRFKLVDFGAAADLRTGYNYEPEQGCWTPSTPRRRTSSCPREYPRRRRCGPSPRPSRRSSGRRSCRTCSTRSAPAWCSCRCASRSSRDGR